MENRGMETDKVERKTTEAMKNAVDPATGWIPKENLPATARKYTFGTEWVPQLSGPVKTELLLEHRVAKGGGGHAKACREDVAAELEKSVGHQIRPDGSVPEEYLEAHKGNSLKAWSDRAMKQTEKALVRKGSWGVNVTNIPFKAGPKEIKEFLERALEEDGAIRTIDPWWAKEMWTHDGGVTVYTSEGNARRLLELGQEGLLFDLPGTQTRQLKTSAGRDGKLAVKVEEKIEDPWD